VPRRVKVEDPKSRHFSVTRVFRKDEEDKEGGGTGKVAPGMEVAFKVVNPTPHIA
jgi:hydrocephalus-inducing protein